MRDRASIQSLAAVVGAVFVVVGVLGFVPGITTHYGSMSFAGHGSGAGCGSGFFSRRKRVSGCPTSSRGVVTSASAMRYSGSRRRKFFRKATRVAAARGLAPAVARTAFN